MPKQTNNRAERREPDQSLPSTRHHPASDLLPRPVFVITAAFENHRRGQLVRYVQLASDSPPSVSVAMPKGQPISPVIRDSKSFGLCQLPDTDEFLERKFAQAHLRGYDEEENPSDPFDSLETTTAETDSPLITRSLMWLDCRVTMHIDLEGDFEMYIGEVVASKLLMPDTDPLIRIGPHNPQ
ncbi:MAG: flavin reductase family protein [Phycisphaerales bacterium JB065]